MEFRNGNSSDDRMTKVCRKTIFFYLKYVVIRYDIRTEDEEKIGLKNHLSPVCGEEACGNVYSGKVISAEHK